MAERRRLGLMRQLLAVQAARRGGAEALLAEARTKESVARDDERAAAAARDGALGDWTRCVGVAGFSPEHSRALSGLVVERDQEADEAGRRAEAASQLADGREQDWRMREAELRAGSKARDRLQRKLVRRGEEQRLTALADQVTRDWRPS